jgi:hypothetical protein
MLDASADASAEAMPPMPHQGIGGILFLKYLFGGLFYAADFLSP